MKIKLLVVTMFLYTSTFAQEELRLENQRPITLISNHTWNQYDAIQPIELNGDSISELFLTRNSEIELCIRRSDSLVCTEVSNAGKIGWHRRSQNMSRIYGSSDNGLYMRTVLDNYTIIQDTFTFNFYGNTYFNQNYYNSSLYLDEWKWEGDNGSGMFIDTTYYPGATYPLGDGIVINIDADEEMEFLRLDQNDNITEIYDFISPTQIDTLTPASKGIPANFTLLGNNFSNGWNGDYNFDGRLDLAFYYINWSNTNLRSLVYLRNDTSGFVQDTLFIQSNGYNSISLNGNFGHKSMIGQYRSRKAAHLNGSFSYDHRLTGQIHLNDKLYLIDDYPYVHYYKLDGDTLVTTDQLGYLQFLGIPTTYSFQGGNSITLNNGYKNYDYLYPTNSGVQANLIAQKISTVCSSSFKVQTDLSDSTICSSINYPTSNFTIVNDSLFSEFRWYNNCIYNYNGISYAQFRSDTINVLQLRDSNEVYIRAVDVNGCLAYSDTFNININQSLVQPLIDYNPSSGYIYSSTSLDSTYWYVDSAFINISDSLQPTSTGRYYLAGYINNCISLSDDLWVIKDSLCAYYDTNTVDVFDTTYITQIDTFSLTVTDTLIIDVSLIGINPPTFEYQILAYPNPTNNFLNVEIPQNMIGQQYSLEIVNALGQSMYGNILNQQQLQINLNSFASTGTYTLQIKDSGGTVVNTKVIILQ